MLIATDKGWRCAGCGVETPGPLKACPCATDCVHDGAGNVETRLIWRSNSTETMWAEMQTGSAIAARPATRSSRNGGLLRRRRQGRRLCSMRLCNCAARTFAAWQRRLWSVSPCWPRNAASCVNQSFRRPRKASCLRRPLPLWLTIGTHGVLEEILHELARCTTG